MSRDLHSIGNVNQTKCGISLFICPKIRDDNIKQYFKNFEKNDLASLGDQVGAYLLVDVLCCTHKAARINEVILKNIEIRF